MDENEALKEELAKHKNNNSNVDRLAVAAADKVKRELAKAEQIIKELRIQLAESHDNKVLEERCRQLQEKIARHELKMKTYEETEQELRATIGKKDSEIARSTEQVREAVAGKEQAEQAASRLHGEIDQLKSAALAATERESALQSANADLEQQLEAMRQSLSHSESDIEQVNALTRQIDENKVLVETLRAANKKLTIELQTAKQSMAVLQEVHDSTVASKEALEVELANERTRQAALEEENRRLVEMLEKLRNEMEKMRAEKESTPSGSRFGNFVALKKENELLQRKLAQYKAKRKTTNRR